MTLIVLVTELRPPDSTRQHFTRAHTGSHTYISGVTPRPKDARVVTLRGGPSLGRRQPRRPHPQLTLRGHLLLRSSQRCDTQGHTTPRLIRPLLIGLLKLLLMLSHSTHTCMYWSFDVWPIGRYSCPRGFDVWPLRRYSYPILEPHCSILSIMIKIFCPTQGLHLVLLIFWGSARNSGFSSSGAETPFLRHILISSCLTALTSDLLVSLIIATLLPEHGL